MEGKSFWTKRRKLQKQVLHHMQNIQSSANEHESDAAISMSDLNEQSLPFDFGNASGSHENVEGLHDEILGSNEISISSADIREELLPDDDSSDDECHVDDDTDLSDSLSDLFSRSNVTTAFMKELLHILRKFHPNLPKDPRTLIRTPEIENVKSLAGGSYYHFGIANGLAQQLSQNDRTEFPEITLFVNIDGLPLFRSSSGEFWPILGCIENCGKMDPFVIGLFYGLKKPSNVHEYLHDFVTEMKDLQQNGFEHNDFTFQVSIAGFICDTPARAFIKCVKGHAGHGGCDKCTQYGLHDGRMTFPQTNAPLRTDVAFDEMIDDEHHHQRSPLADLGIGMVSCFPLDYMHLVCLGVVRKLINYWLKGPLKKYKIGLTVKASIAEKLGNFISYMPREFVRKPRDIREVDRWKATEFRQFLLYTGPVCLFNNLAPEIYANFLLLSVGIYYLVNPSLCSDYADHANKLLKLFVEHTFDLYESTSVIYNVHGLIHLSDEVKRFGALDRFSAFRFESYLGEIKRLLRKPSYPLKQVVKRLQDRSKHAHYLQICCKSGVQLKGEHHKGPLLHGHFSSNGIQYEQMQLKDYCVSRKKGDNCVRIGNDIAIVRNILKCGTDLFVAFQTFKRMDDFFSYPANSSELGIYKVTGLSMEIKVTSVSDISHKYILLPLSASFVAMPLIHTGP